MRSFFISLAFAAICSCTKTTYVTPQPPDDVVVDTYLDLRHPIYIAIEENFWSGCDSDPVGNRACRSRRIDAFKEGVDQWFEYFVKATRPKVVFISSGEELPSDRVNPIIYLMVKDKACEYEERGKKKHHEACFHKEDSFSVSYIAFEKAVNIYPALAAHEFGHALGRTHDDFPTGAISIMIPVVPRESRVLQRDIDILCKEHVECPSHIVN